VTSELKTCPFCAGSAHRSATLVSCNRCGVYTPASDWNRRAPSPAVARLVEACRALIELQRGLGGPKPEEVRKAQAALAAVEREMQ
jgi:hypothetical protein